ncbi:MAG: Do family serine endopeptidase [Gemmatimonadota bacterium]
MKKDREANRTHDPLRSKAKLALGTAVALVAGLGLASGLGWTHVTLPAIDEAPQVRQEAIQPALDLSDAFVSIAEVVTPAVVRIEAVRPGRRVATQLSPNVPDAFRQFFRDQEPEQQPRLGGGSGFIISPDGYILTNDHVVGGANDITVYLSDRREFSAKVVGSDPYTDVAVIKIEADHDLPTLSFGDAESVRVGEWVLAVGNPGFGAGNSTLDYTVTAGIVSARGRGLQLINRELNRDPATAANAPFAIEDFIQTDAVINPGNSGGPMVDLKGQVIGINSAIASQSGFYQGYGFAVPINIARRVMEDLVEYGYVKRPLIGVSITEVTAEAAEYYGLPSIAGAFVNDITGAPARNAGIQDEDVIVAVDGKPVGYPNQLQQRVAEYHPGDEVTVTLYRDGKPLDVQVRLGEAPINEVQTPVAAVETAAEDRLGFAVEPLTPEVAERLGYEQAEGVVISDVQPLSPAGRQSLGRGLRLVAINDHEIHEPNDVREALDDVEPGSVVALHTELPGGTPRIFHVRMPGN